MEGIVRQTWRHLPECDLCFVYMVTESLAPPLYDGRFPCAASVMETVAERCGILSNRPALEVARRAKAAPLERATPRHGRQDGLRQRRRPSLPRNLPRALCRRHRPFDGATGSRRRWTPPTNLVRLDVGKDALARSFAGYSGGIFRGTRPGEALTFRFEGTYAGLYDLLGPDYGQAIVTVDGRSADRPALRRLLHLPPAREPRGGIRPCRQGTLGPKRDLSGAARQGRDPGATEREDGQTGALRRPVRYPGALLLVGDLLG